MAYKFKKGDKVVFTPNEQAVSNAARGQYATYHRTTELNKHGNYEIYRTRSFHVANLTGKEFEILSRRGALYEIGSDWFMGAEQLSHAGTQEAKKAQESYKQAKFWEEAEEYGRARPPIRRG